MEENIEVKDVQKTEYLDKNGLDMLWAKVKENTNNQVEVERNRAVAKENSIADTKADKSALTNEVTRATGAENGLQAAIETKADIAAITELNQNVYQLTQQMDTKADALVLSNYVLTTALNQQIDTLNTSISAKQDAGNYLSYKTVDKYSVYSVLDGAAFKFENLKNFEDSKAQIDGLGVSVVDEKTQIGTFIRNNYISIVDDNGSKVKLSDKDGGQILVDSKYNGTSLTISKDGIALLNGDNNHVLTSNASTIDITQYALKTELPTVPTKTSELTNDSNFITADDVDDEGYYLYDALNFGLKNNGVITIDSTGIRSDVSDGFNLDGDGITFYARGISDIPTAQGGFVDISNYALESQVTVLQQAVTDNTTAIEGKQDKGNYIPYTANGDVYEITSPISVAIKNKESITITNNRISISGSDDPESIDIDRNKLMFSSGSSGWTKYDINGITSIVYSDCLATSDGTFKPISDFVLSSAYNEKIAALEARIAALEAKHP